MDTLNALTIELNAELDEVRRAVRKCVCERRTADIPGEVGLLGAILRGIWLEAVTTHDLTMEKLVADAMDELIYLVGGDKIIERSYRLMRKTLRLTQYLNERPF